MVFHEHNKKSVGVILQDFNRAHRKAFITFSTLQSI